MESRTTVVIPLDDRVLFVSSLNCAEFSSRRSEVAQTFDTIPGSTFRRRQEGSKSGGVLARSLSAIAPAVGKAVGEHFAVWVQVCWCYGA